MRSLLSKVNLIKKMSPLFHKAFLLQALQKIKSLIPDGISKRSFSLKAKITFLIIFIVAVVLFISGYIDFELSRKAQIELYLDRNLYIAKQIDIGIPDQKMMDNLPRIREEMEEWLMSRPSLREIDVFLFSAKGLEIIVSHSKQDHPALFTLAKDQIHRLKKDKHLSSLHDVEDEKWLEVIVPLHSGEKVIGGVRVVSSLNEVRSYLNKKRDRTILLTLSSIFIIFISLAFLFGKLVGAPVQKLVEAMSRAEEGNLGAETHIQSKDELGELGRHFNRMLKTIREAHTQNVQLLTKVNQFNEELTRKVETATSELAARNEELRLLNEALFESQRQLSQSEKLAAMGQVAAIMAHQIGTPLNSISGYIQLMLQEGTFQVKERERLKIIDSQLDRLEESVKNLLSFTRQPKPERIPLNLNDILEELIHLSEPWLHTRNVQLIYDRSPHKAFILGDSTHLQTLFLNLITNAVDAMPHGGLLTIKTQKVPISPSSENGSWIEISITDTGIGITEESKKRIFDPFFTTKKLGEGSGLGLTICENIVKEHFGRLEVTSEIGKGSTFYVFIPISRRDEVDEGNIPSAFGRG